MKKPQFRIWGGSGIHAFVMYNYKVLFPYYPSYAKIEKMYGKIFCLYKPNTPPQTEALSEKTD